MLPLVRLLTCGHHMGKSLSQVGRGLVNFLRSFMVLALHLPPPRVDSQVCWNSSNFWSQKLFFSQSARTKLSSSLNHSKPSSDQPMNFLPPHSSTIVYLGLGFSFCSAWSLLSFLSFLAFKSAATCFRSSVFP